jgi:hypothetical protein
MRNEGRRLAMSEVEMLKTVSGMVSPGPFLVLKERLLSKNGKALVVLSGLTN